MRLFFLAAVFFSSLACAGTKTVAFETPISVDTTFARSPAKGAEAKRFEAAAAYSEKFGGRAFLVMQGDAVVFETGQNGHKLSDPYHLFSGTKTFSCALLAIAREDGKLEPSSKVRDIVPELPQRAASLTVNQLLHLTSGTKQDFFRLSLDGARAEPRVADKNQVAVEAGFSRNPGKAWQYGAADFFLFGEVMKRTYDRDPLDLLEERIFEPISMKTAGWVRDPAGNPALPYGAFTTVNEWAKFGVLLRDDGEFLGKRVVKKGLLHSCFRGSKVMPAYGAAIWLNREAPEGVNLSGFPSVEKEGPLLSSNAPDDLVAAAGHQDQRLYVIESLDLVVVRLSNGAKGFKDKELIDRLLGAQ